MWRTSSGERVLQGAEGQLFRASLAAVCHLVEDSFGDEELFSSGVSVFDALQPGQKVAMLAIVGKALLDKTTPCPELTAVAEGTVAAIFEQIEQAVELEIDVGSDPGAQPVFWRQLILAACKEAEGEDDEPLPKVTSDDLEDWRCLVECLADRILWDCDFEMEEEFLDADPDESRSLRERCRIPEAYFLRVAPDPTGEQLEQIRCTLREITGQA
jgi:hypothetical protein